MDPSHHVDANARAVFEYRPVHSVLWSNLRHAHVDQTGFEVVKVAGKVVGILLKYSILAKHS